MPPDKYTATWVSHSSISDFLACPRAYYLNNVYRDSQTHHKISLINPPLALGQAVHEVVESLSTLPVKERFKEPLPKKFAIAWKKISGKCGGFINQEQEENYKQRGLKMLKTIIDNPGPLNNLAVKIQMDLPYYWLSETDNIILCGKIDWLEYLPDDESIHIIDFKTGNSKEDPKSLQLPIYHLLVHHCQNRKVTKASYWYLNSGSALSEKQLPDLEKAKKAVFKIAKQISLARKLEVFKCPHQTGCRFCNPLEAIINGQAEFVGTNEYNQDLYILAPSKLKYSVDSLIL